VYHVTVFSVELIAVDGTVSKSYAELRASCKGRWDMYTVYTI